MGNTLCFNARRGARRPVTVIGATGRLKAWSREPNRPNSSEEEIPVQYRIDRPAGIVYVTVTGVVTRADIITERQRFAEDPDFSPDLMQLIDAREADEFRLTLDEIRDVARSDPFGPGSRRAVVAREDVIYGLFRMYEVLTSPSGSELYACRELEEAREWLGLESLREKRPADNGDGASAG